jgi:hypothetical protein
MGLNIAQWWPTMPATASMKSLHPRLLRDVLDVRQFLMAGTLKLNTYRPSSGRIAITKEFEQLGEFSRSRNNSLQMVLL